jgi:hypothetical protein
MFRAHWSGMIVAATLLLAAQSASASLGVGATVVRSEPQPVAAVEQGNVVVRNAGRATVSADGARIRRGGGLVTVTPAGAGTIFVTLTY